MRAGAYTICAGRWKRPERKTVVNRRSNLTPRIAASANVTVMAPLPMTIRCRLIGRARWFPGLLDEKGCGRVGPYIAPAVHNPGQ